MIEGFEFPGPDHRELIRTYLAQLPAKLTLIESLWTRVQASPADRTALSQLHLQVHRVAGSAAPHGLPTLGQSARLMDRALASLAKHREAPTEESLAGLVPLLMDLRRALRQAS